MVRVSDLNYITSILLVFLISAPAWAQNTGTVPSARDRLFSDSSLGIQVLVPSGVEVLRPEGPIDLVLQSGNGWWLNVQSANRNDSRTVPDLVARLESKYLGAGKPWSKKLSGRQLDSTTGARYDALYLGAGTIVRLVLIREPARDYVLMFIAPEDAFSGFAKEFDRILASFQPLEDATKPLKEHNTFPIEEQKKPENSTRFERFNAITLGFSLLYPMDWHISRPSETTVVFQGKEGGTDAFATISVQNVSPPTGVNDSIALNAVIQQLKAQMAYSVSDVSHASGTPFTLGSADKSVSVHQILSDYAVNSIPYRQWTLFIPRQGEGLVHVWAYAAPLEYFAHAQPIAEKMAGSWTFEPVSR